MAKTCTRFVKSSRIKAEENNRKAIFRNDSRAEFGITTVDGCLITEGERADYLVSDLKSASVLIELKGSDVGKACSRNCSRLLAGLLRVGANAMVDGGLAA